MTERRNLCPFCKKPLADAEGRVSISVSADGAFLSCRSCGAMFSPYEESKAKKIVRWIVLGFTIISALALIYLLLAVFEIVPSPL